VHTNRDPPGDAASIHFSPTIRQTDILVSKQNLCGQLGSDVLPITQPTESKHWRKC